MSDKAEIPSPFARFRGAQLNVAEAPRNIPGLPADGPDVAPPAELQAEHAFAEAYILLRAAAYPDSFTDETIAERASAAWRRLGRIASEDAEKAAFCLNVLFMNAATKIDGLDADAALDRAEAAHARIKAAAGQSMGRDQFVSRFLNARVEARGLPSGDSLLLATAFAQKLWRLIRA